MNNLDAFVEARTGLSLDRWAEIIQEKIPLYSSPHPNVEGHDQTDFRACFADVHDLVAEGIKHNLDFDKADENMAFAACWGAILVSWFTALKYAKSSDPRRPYDDRVFAFAQLVDYCCDFIDGLSLAEVADSAHKRFPDQEFAEAHRHAASPRGYDAFGFFTNCNSG